MENKENNFALLVHACDRYELLYKGFQYFFNKYWDFKLPCTYYFATEEKKVDLDGFVNILSGRGEWSDRLRILLEKIPQNYIIYLQEDMWFNAAIDAEFFQQLFNLITTNNWKQVKLHCSSVYTTKATDIYIKGFNVAIIDNKKSGFLMSHQITIWDKQFLISLLKPKEHPWRNERRATKRMKKINPQIFHIDYFAENGHDSINSNLESIVRSGYHSISVNGTLNDNVQPFIYALLEESNQPIKEYGHKLKYHFERQLTHDGLKKPRKVDVFKRIKNWLQGK
jgi:hypothetical protein